MSAVRKSTSSISSSSRAPSILLPTGRYWLVGGVCGGILALLIAWMTAGTTDDPEVRIAGTASALSALVVDGDQRVLLVNASGPRDARAVLGTLSRPWEPDPSTVVVGADRDNAEAVWETLQRLRPRQLIVAGAPGADPDWSAIERFCRESGIDISYLENPTAVVLPTLALMVVPPSAAGRAPSYVEVEGGPVRAALALGGLPDVERLHLAVTDERRSTGSWSDVWVIAGDAHNGGEVATIRLDPGERIDAVLEPGSIRLQGNPAEAFERR